jgi:5-bromo-4-chloroindolyl phosphate hydrolysis protein
VKRGAQRKGRTNKAVAVKRRGLTKRVLFILSIALLVAASTIAKFVLQRKSNKAPAAFQNTATTKTPHILAELLVLSPAELERCDIARMNLLCAEGLPGAEKLNVEKCLATLDQWAEGIKFETKRNYHHFREDPAYYYNSENFYKMLIMAVVLYDDYQVRYNPKWIESPEAIRPDDGFGSDSRDILIHGLVGPQHMGTCSSLPVLYAALARRLGYPVKLVTAKAHLFMRWDSRTEIFNMDATGKGMDEFKDEHFKQWPFPITETEIKAEGYLQSLTSAQELSVFLRMRAFCLRQAGRFNEAIAAHAAALKLEPNWRGNQYLFAEAQQELAIRQMLNNVAELEMVEKIMAANRARREQLGFSGNSPAPDPTPHLPTPQ